MVSATGIGAGDLVLDVGAGRGSLTAPLVAAGARVVAVELHAGRAAALRRRFADDDVTVVQTDLHGLRLPHRPFHVVASPPYAATTGLVRLLLGTDRLVSAHLVLQRQAVGRLVAHPPGARHARRYALTAGRPVPRGAFDPPPRVDSQLLVVRRR